MPCIPVNGTDLFFTDDGSGKPLLFLHGLGASHDMFQPQVQTFCTSHRVLCPDLRGSGLSGKLTGPTETVLDRQGDDIEALLDTLGIPHVVICGISYGGVLAFHYSLRHPGRLAGMVIVDSFGDTRIGGPAEAILLTVLYLGLGAYYLPGSWLAAAVRRQYRRWPLAQEHLVRIVTGMRRTEAVLQRLATLRPDHTRLLGQVRCPVLGIVGDGSRIAVQFMRRALAAIPAHAWRSSAIPSTRRTSANVTSLIGCSRTSSREWAGDGAKWMPRIWLRARPHLDWPTC